MAIPRSETQALQELLRRRAGYDLTDERAHLAENRLAPLARREGCSVAELVAGLETARASLGWEVVEAMLAADTQFFRDRQVFRVMDELLPALARARPEGRVRVLSAGCASGQEAWSLAMAAAEADLPGVEVVGLDLSVRGLEKARQGLYTPFEVQKGLSARRLVRWLERHEEAWRVHDDLRALVRFERRNLLDGIEGFGVFDLVLCRHVLIDMTPPARRRVLAGLEAALAPDGCLLLGAGEILPETLDAFRPVAGRAGLYVKNPARLSQAA